jgi:hypothetical protein|tara:strand:+ start:22 stop:198 length:177 start_codon:yes stop_codon:yes gene_type:complete
MKEQKDELHHLLDEMYEAVVMIKKGKINFSNKVFQKLKSMFEMNISQLSSIGDHCEFS